jgi:hypothetical protein
MNAPKRLAGADIARQSRSSSAPEAFPESATLSAILSTIASRAIVGANTGPGGVR